MKKLANLKFNKIARENFLNLSDFPKRSLFINKKKMGKMSGVKNILFFILHTVTTASYCANFVQIGPQIKVSKKLGRLGFLKISRKEYSNIAN